MSSKQKKHIAVLDIGASKVIVMVAELLADNNIKILGIGHQSSQGIGKNAVMSDIRNLEYCLINALSAAEKASGKDIEEIYVNITGNMLQSSLRSIDADISRGELKERDLEKMRDESYSRFKTQNLDVIQSVPINYAIDGIDGIANPCYMSGKKLVAYFNVVQISASAKNNYANCIARCHLNINGFIPSAYAAGEAVLTEDEKQAGALVLDIGKNMTDIAIYSDGNLVFVSSLGFGGGVITSDIKQILSLTEKGAERLKVIYGSVFPDNSSSKDDIDLFDMIEGKDFDHSNYIQKHQLTDIIYERVYELFKYIHQYLANDPIAKRYLHRVVGNIVITGGTSNLVGMPQLIENIFNGKVRVGKVPQFIDLPEEHYDPSNVVACGLLRIAAKEMVHKQNNVVSLRAARSFRNIVNMFKTRGGGRSFLDKREGK